MQHNKQMKEKKMYYLKTVHYAKHVQVKYYNTLTDNAEGVNVVMPIYNLIEYSDNYSKTSLSER